MLYTDGITDVPPPHDLGPDGMERLLQKAALGATTADAIATNLGQDIDNRLPFIERDDDIAMLVLKVHS